MQRPRLLLADGSSLLVDALSKLLESKFQIVGTVTDGPSLLDNAARLRPDVVILEINLPNRKGVNVGRELRSLLPNTRIVLMMGEDSDQAAEDGQLCANAYLPKRCTSAELYGAIQDVLRGRSYVSRQIVRRMHVGNPAPDKPPLITDRQREVLRLLAEGQTMREAAEELGITPRTVAYHKYEVMRECNLRSNVDILRFAIQQGILSLPR